MRPFAFPKTIYGAAFSAALFLAGCQPEEELLTAQFAAPAAEQNTSNGQAIAGQYLVVLANQPSGTATMGTGRNQAAYEKRRSGRSCYVKQRSAAKT